MADPFTPKFVDLVKNVTTTTGTGDFTLGAAVNGFQSFSTALQIGDRFYYSCLGTDKPAEREVGRGTLLSGGKIAREPIGGAAKTNFTTGSKAIALIAAAEWFDGVAGSVAGATSAAASASAAATAATAALNGIESDLGALEIQVASLDSELDGTSQDLAALEATVAALEGGGASVATRGELAALAGTAGTVCVLGEAGREGLFKFDESNLAAQVAADGAQGLYVPPASASSGAAGAWVRVTNGELRPEWFGAKGDATTNDTIAFAALNAMIALRDGGEVVLRSGATYVVGAQTFVAGQQTTGFSFPPDVQYLIDFDGCGRQAILRGNGATIKAAAGLKYGAFNDDGSDKDTSAGYLGGGLATPYYAMVRARDCTAGVWIENLVLDGNAGALNLGGRYGDNDWQLAATGIQLGHWGAGGNLCPVVISNVHAHHQGQDGMSVSAPGTDANDPIHPVTLINCEFDTNARQGLSWVGGKGLTAVGCKFNNTGRGAWSSAPRAGVDIEPESALSEHGEFINCEFVNNSGAGVLGYGGPSFIAFRGCKFIGTTASTVSEFGPYWSFDNCLFTGQLVNGFASSLAPEATRFDRCKFLFGTARSPTGSVYAPSGHMFDFGGSGATNISFNQCLFDSEGNLGVQLSYLSGAVLRDCEVVQDGTGGNVAQYCRFEGTNRITAGGPMDLYESSNRGDFIVNGTSQMRRWGSVDEFSLGSFTIGSNGGELAADGKELWLKNTSGYGLRAAMNGSTNELYMDNQNGSFSFAPFNLRGSTVTLIATGGAVNVSGGLSVSGALTASNFSGSSSGTNSGDETGATIVAKSSGQALTPASIAATGALTSSGGKLGYATGNGGTVTQSPNKSSAVTLNKACGEITMNNAALAANTAITFTLTNSLIEAGDRLIVNHKSGGTFGAYVCDARAAAGSATVMLRNVTAGSLSEAVVLGFAVIKAVTA